MFRGAPFRTWELPMFFLTCNASEWGEHFECRETRRLARKLIAAGLSIIDQASRGQTVLFAMDVSMSVAYMYH